MLSVREQERYKRQIFLFGKTGQEKLTRSHIVIAGAGGLGCPISMYLAIAGVGKITIVDRDIVDRTNLNRQILHYERDIGKKKTTSAGEKLREINPEITINIIDTTIDKANIARIVGNADGIVDALDNFSTRYLLNETALKKKIPLFHGAIRGFFGQVTTIIPGQTPCLACIFPKSPPEDECPVIGVAPGFIGIVQATEVLKYLLQEGKLLTNRLLVWDGLGSRAEEIAVERNPSCPVCGSRRKAGARAGKKK